MILTQLLTIIKNITLENCLFGAVKLTKNTDISKYKYYGYGIGFDGKEAFSRLSGEFGNNVIIFGVDTSSSAHVDNKKKDILILGGGPTQELHGTIITAEKMYSVNFKCIHYNGANNYLFVNGTEIHKFKAKDSETVAAPLCLGNISQDLSTENMKKTGLIGSVYDFSVDYDPITVNNVLDIHKYLMKKNGIT